MNKRENEFKSPGISTRCEMEIYINPKLHAIEFTKYVSNHKVLDDFWTMSIEAQEEVYEQFLKNTKLNDLEKKQIVIYCDSSDETAHEIAIELLEEFGAKYEDDGKGTITYWVKPIKR